MWPFKKWQKGCDAKPKRWPLSLPLFRLSEHDFFTLADAFESVQIYGATGSGKSSGSGRTCALSYLRAGMGGLVLTAKAEERALWEEYCREAGRLDDLMVMSPSLGLRFNFLDYELHRSGPGGGLTENLVNTFTEVLEVGQRQNGAGGREDAGYWRTANQQLVRNCLELLILGRGHVSLYDLYRVVVSLPTSPEQVNDASWQAKSFAFATLQAADKTDKSAMRRRDFELCTDYVLFEYPALSDKTRSIIVSTFTSMIDVLQRGVLRELFSTTTNVTPEATTEGRILLLDLPVKEYLEVGRIAQVLMKYIFMRAIEHRPWSDDMRPVFLWADESQYFTSPYDFQFQSTARSSRVATVYLTQNISNYYAMLGGDETGKAGVDSLMANMNTKILHANGDSVTNTWCAEMIGRSRQYFVNASQSRPVDMAAALMGFEGGTQSSSGISEVMELEVPPRAFTTLRKGGIANAGQIDAIVFQGGRRL